MKYTTLISGSNSELAFDTIQQLSKKNKLVLITSNKQKLLKKIKSLKILIIEQSYDKIENINAYLEKKKIKINSIIHFNGVHGFDNIQNISKDKFDFFFNANCFSFLNLIKTLKLHL